VRDGEDKEIKRAKTKKTKQTKKKKSRGSLRRTVEGGGRWRKGKGERRGEETGGERVIVSQRVVGLSVRTAVFLFLC